MRLLCCLSLCLPLFSAGCVSVGAASEDAVLRAKDRVIPALVHIRPVVEVFSEGRRTEMQVVGSGFIVSPDGYVLTNEHVVGRSTTVRCVLSSKEEVDAHVVGVDPPTDLAVLKLDTERRDLPTVKFGSSRDIEAGQTVLALGSPHGLARSVSLGIISVTERYLGSGMPRSAPYHNFIQTDAAINPGNSGGPLVNLRGEVIGVNSMKLTGADNLGFAIPVDVAKEVADQIIAHGSVRRSTIGVEFQEMLSMTNNAEKRGVVVADVASLSPAAEAGLRPGDVLLAVNGEPVHARFSEDLPAVRKYVADLPPGQPVTLTISRGDEEVSLTMTTEEESELEGKQVELAEWGFTVSEVTPAIARRARLDSTQGVLVSGTQLGGIASNAELNQGDILLTVDGEPVQGIDQFITTYRSLVEARKKLVLMDVKRGALTRYALIRQSPEARDAEEGLLPGESGGMQNDAGMADEGGLE